MSTRSKGTGNTSVSKITLPSIELTEYGEPRWISKFNVKRDITINFPSDVDVTALTFTTEISEIDVAPGVEPQPNAPEKSNGEVRPLIETSKSGNTVVFTLSEHLGTQTDNEGATASFEAPVKPEYLSPKFYFLSMKWVDANGYGDLVRGQIANQFNNLIS